MPKYEAGEVAGADADIRHYIGEMHLMRALVYYNLLRTYGDFPIVTEVLPDDKTVLMEKGVRQPRNLVARFILKDLDDAANMMYSKGFKNNTRLNRETALLIKSRVALYEASFERYHKGTGRVPGDDNWPGKKVHFKIRIPSGCNRRTSRIFNLCIRGQSYFICNFFRCLHGFCQEEVNLSFYIQ